MPFSPGSSCSPLLGGALSALAASLFLVAPESVRSRVLPHLVSFATGALLGAALLGLLPHAIEQVGICRNARHRPDAAGGTAACSSCSKRWCSGGTVTRTSAKGMCRTSTRTDAHARCGVGVAHPDRRWLPQRARRRAHRRGVHDGRPSRRRDRACRHRARDPAGSRRPRDPAPRRHVAPARPDAESADQPDLRGRRRRGLFRARPRSSRRCPTRSPSPQSSFLYIAVADLIPGLHRRVDAGSGVRQFVFIVLGVAVIYVSHSHGALERCRERKTGETQHRNIDAAPTGPAGRRNAAALTFPGFSRPAPAALNSGAYPLHSRHAHGQTDQQIPAGAGRCPVARDRARPSVHRAAARHGGPAGPAGRLGAATCSTRPASTSICCARSSARRSTAWPRSKATPAKCTSRTSSTGS